MVYLRRHAYYPEPDQLSALPAHKTSNTPSGGPPGGRDGRADGKYKCEAEVIGSKVALASIAWLI